MIEEFKIQIPDEVLSDLSLRLSKSKYPNTTTNSQWEKGTNREYLHSLISYWQNEYNWREQEQKLNQYPQYTCLINGVKIHYYHVKGKGRHSIPLILTHGWPDSFLRYIKLIPLLTDPANHGGNPDYSFDVIIPSVPGFGFSSISEDKGLNNSEVADLWKELMVNTLGYNVFGAVGGDIGSGVTRYLALHYPEHLIGIHLTDVGIIRDLLAAKDESKLTTEEINYKKSATEWMAREGGYMSIQSTKPQTLSYGLSDSPVGLAAWIIEKFHSWSDCNGNLANSYSKDELLNNIMIYWITNTVGSSCRMYYENMHSLPPMGKITVPTGMALFAKDILLPPKSWVENNLNLIQWTEITKGGHFAAMEEPKLYAEDVIEFFGNLQ